MANSRRTTYTREMIDSIMHQARRNALEEAATFYESYRCVSNAKDGYSPHSVRPTAFGKKKAMADAIRKLNVANA